MRITDTPHHPWRLSISALALAILAACGGGGSGGTTSTSNSGGSTSLPSAFPSGVTVSSPASLDSSGNVVASSERHPTRIRLPWSTRVADWSRTMWQAIQTQDTHTAGHLLLKLLPMSNAWAATSKVPEGVVVASEIDAVAKGSLPLSHPGLLNLGHLFGGGSVNTQCFGPSVAYTNHDNYVSGPNQSGTLPSGDLGLWTADNTDSHGTQPCATATLNDKLEGSKRQMRQAMLLMAGIRRLIASSGSLSMPAANQTTDVQSALATVLSGIAPGVSVDAATVSLNNLGTVYTYRLALSAGSGASAKQGEVVVQHTPGASATQYAGIVQITASQLGSDSAFGCSDQIDSGTSLYKVATVSTIRYDKNGTDLDVGARSANYCGAPAPSSSSYIDDIAELDGNGMLDFSVDLGGNNARGSIKGWRGNASRFSASLDTATQAGDFSYIWQAGNLDSHARGFAVHSSYNSSTEARTLDAFYAYTQSIAATNGDMLGMLCNWAGPGNNHTPVNYFQSQRATLSSSASIWTRTASHIAYAPTVSCNSGSGMRYDADGNTTIDTLEGQSVTNDLDTLSLGNANVADELSSRGYNKPNLF